MTRASLLCAVAATVIASGCGPQSADDIARNIDDAVKASRPKPELRLPETGPPPEAETESAAKRAVCRALDAYSSDPSQSLSEYIGDYAERQRVLADFYLNEIDPNEAERLADAASDIGDSQEAAEVAGALGCS